MALPAPASLKREKPFATSEEKTASPVGPSVTVSRFGLAMEECGLTSQTDSTDSQPVETPQTPPARSVQPVGGFLHFFDHFDLQKINHRLN